jgi:pimeloyl-ACP methyl ester carboxylesterase
MGFVSINNQKIFYDDSGGDGKPLIFLHGFLFDATMFDAQVQELAPDYRCIRIDTRGFGKTVWDGEEFSLYDTVSDVIGVMDALNLDKVAMIGMSQGAYATIRLAVKHPERLTSMVLMSTRKDILPEEFKQNYVSLRDNWVKLGPFEEGITALMTLLIGSQEEFGEYWDMWRPKWKIFSGNQMYHTINALLSRVLITDEQLGQVETPILSIHGVEDYGTPLALADVLYASLPNGKGKVRVPGAAHAVNMTHADQIAAPLRAFLDKYA